MGCKLIIGFSLFIVVLTLGVFFGLRVSNELFTDTEQYRLAEQCLLQDTLLRRELGEVTIDDFGGYTYADSAGISFQLKSQGGPVVVVYHLVKDGESWRVSSIARPKFQH
jgi:hypothetical protein